MTSRRRRESGFTIIELLIVIVVIGILAGLVLNVFTGIQQDARDSERKTDLEAVQAHLEAYQAKNSKYPTTSDMSAANFIAFAGTNFKGLDTDALYDPNGDGQTTLYVYAATPNLCDNSTTDCTGFTLTANLEDGTQDVRTSAL